MEMMKPWFQIPLTERTAHSAIVIGAGMAGAAVARCLADEGWSVMVFDSHTIASGASGNRAGIVSPESNLSDQTENFYSEAFQLAQQRIEELADIQKHQDGLKLSYDWCGSVEFKRLSKQRKSSKIELSDSVFQKTNLLFESDEGVTVHPEAGWVSPKELCRTQLYHPRITVFENTPVESIQWLNSEWKVITSDGGESCAPVLILANGQAALQFEPCSQFPLQSVRGQLTELPKEYFHHPIKKILCYEGYLIPAINGVYTLGATFDRDDFDFRLRTRDHQKNLEQLEKRIVGCFKKPVCSFDFLQGRVGFRSSSLDHLPLIGPVPKHDCFLQDYQDLHHGKPLRYYPLATYWPGLYVSLGHGSRGILSSLMGGALLSAILNQRPLPLKISTMESIHPARFLIRQLKRQSDTNHG